MNWKMIILLDPKVIKLECIFDFKSLIILLDYCYNWCVHITIISMSSGACGCDWCLTDSHQLGAVYSVYCLAKSVHFLEPDILHMNILVSSRVYMGFTFIIYRVQLCSSPINIFTFILFLLLSLLNESTLLHNYILFIIVIIIGP